MIQVLKDCLEIKQKLLTHSRFYLFCWVTLCLTMYTIYTVQQKETWKLSSVDLAPHLHVSPFSTTSSQQVVIFLCTIPGYRDHNSNALFCFFRCTIYCSYCVVQENPWIYFSYLKFRVLTSISPASPFPLPTLPLQPQPPASVFLSAFCILRFHTEVRSGTLLFLCLPACLHLTPVSVLLVRDDGSPVWALNSGRAWATFSVSSHLLVDLSGILSCFCE